MFEVGWQLHTKCVWGALPMTNPGSWNFGSWVGYISSSDPALGARSGWTLVPKLDYILMSWSSAPCGAHFDSVVRTKSLFNPTFAKTGIKKKRHGVKDIKAYGDWGLQSCLNRSQRMIELKLYRNIAVYILFSLLHVYIALYKALQARTRDNYYMLCY